ncbi:MAG: glycosyltransferase family 39 protein [Bacteroidota bacterium]
MSSPKRNNTIIYITLLIIQLIVLAIYLIPQLSTDLWNDEIYTLRHFTLVPLLTTCTDYHVPNNHLFFNLINNLYLNIIGLKHLSSLMNHVWIIRIIPLLYTIITVFIMYLIGGKFFNKTTAFLSVIILLTTIPFLNYAAQVRGYSLSMLLFTLILYYILSSIVTSKTYKYIIIAIFTALLIYTIPSNIYFVGSLIIFFIFRFLYYLYQSKGKLVGSYLNLLLIISLTLGIGIALVLYKPIFKEVFYNEYVVSHAINLHYAKYISLNVITGFISFRWILIVLFLFGMLFLFSSKNKKETKLFYLLMFIFLYIFPFIISTLRGDEPPDRVFTVLMPVFSIIISYGIVLLIQNIKRLQNYTLLSIIIVFIISNVSYVYGISKVKERILHDITDSEGRSHENMYSYYQFYFHPKKEVEQLIIQFNNGVAKVIVTSGEPHDLPEYLERYKIAYYNDTYIDSIPHLKGNIYIFTSHPKLLKYQINKVCPECKLEMISKEISYHNLFLIKH